MAEPRRATRKARGTSNRFADDDLSLQNQKLLAANRRKDGLLARERKAREEAERADQVKSDFLALLSHEFRTPLQAIFGYTELLEREIHGPLTDAQRRDLLRIQQSQQQILRLLAAILDFGKLESGELVHRAGND
jgi:signal transduction histidine kinase